MSKVLLDTDILSEYLKGHDKVVARQAASYAQQHGAFTFTSVTVHEIVFGLEFKGASAQLAKALAWLNQNEQITPTASDYQEAAIISPGANIAFFAPPTRARILWRLRSVDASGEMSGIDSRDNC